MPDAPTLDDYFRVAAPHLGKVLLSARARDRLHVLARQLPLSDLAGLECSLGPVRSRVDLIVRLPRGRFDLPAKLIRNAAWRGIRRSHAQVHNPTSAIYDGVNVMGLEFDVLPGSTGVPTPAVFFELNRQASLSAGDVRTIANRLTGRALARPVAEQLRRCLRFAPSGSQAFQLGAMLSRPGKNLRLVLSHVPTDSVLSYLWQVGWTGDVATATSMLEALATQVETLALSMDLGATVYPRVGLECYVSPGLGYQQAWRPRLRFFERHGLCTKEKALALLAWQGACQPSTCAAGLWPAHLAWGDRFLAPRAASVISRSLGHVKVVVDRDRRPLAKGYLGFAHYWVERPIPPAT